MVVAVAILFGVFFVLLALGMRVSFALAVACVLCIFAFQGPVTEVAIAQRMVSTLARAWPLLSIPLFILAGQIFKFGAAENLVNMSNVFFGKVRGGLAIVNVVASFFFGGISGSATADTAAIGGILIPAMVEAGYDADFSTVVTITSSTLGPIVPPSTLMIMYAWMTGGSVAAMFAGGYVPGFFLTVALSLLSYIISVKRRYPAYERPPLRECLRILCRALPALGLIAIIVGGILGGIFTPTEAAAVAVVYGFVVSVFVYRRLKWRDIPEILRSTVRTTGTVGLLIAFAGAFSWLLTYARVPYAVTELITSMRLNAATFLLLSMFLMLILGCFMNPSAALLMSIPLLYPPSVSLGIHPIHFGIVMTVALAFGHVTPPVGLCLFIGSSISGVPISKLVAPLLPFLAVMIGVVVLLIVWPQVVLFIPRLLGYA